jgi:AbrB family looped-hinge helix DNA binding protein
MAADRDSRKGKDDSGPEFFGSATVGERGQIVIPAGARQQLDIRPGDKLMIFSNLHGKRSLSVMKAEQVTEYVSRAMAKLSRIEEIAREEKA